MSEKVLHLGSGLDVPAEDILTGATFVVGKRGRGKSGAVKRIEEELYRVRLPFTVMDPAGVHWGIRFSGDGKGPGLPDVLIIGGKHADLRLDRRAGAEVARAVAEANISCVIDFKAEPKAAYREFIRDYSHELFRIDPPPRVIILEEATRLVPQHLYPGMQECFEAVEKLVSQGRNEAIGVIGVTQRPATLNKDVLSEADLLLIFGLVSPQDRDAIRKWVETHDDDKRLAEFDAGIAGLQRQECWAWAPERKLFRRSRIHDFKTLHGDKTHLRRLGLLDVKLVQTDVSAVIAKLGKTMDRLAKEKTDIAQIPHLQAEVRRLTAKLASQPAAPAGPDPGTAEEISRLRTRSLHDHAVIVEANRRLGRWVGLAGRAGKVLMEATPEGWGPVDSDAPITGAAEGKAGAPSAPRTFAGERSRPAPKPAAPTPHYPPLPGTTEGEPDGGEIHLKSGAVRMLRELASRHPLTLTYSQLATLVGMTPSGGTASTYYSTLRRAGYLKEDRDGNVSVTDAGREFLGSDVPPAPSTHEEVMERWRRVLKDGCYRILDRVAQAHPLSVPQEVVALETGFAVDGGTWGTYVGILRRNGLVETDERGLTAASILWP